ncbi:MAG: PD40 domain-containing protein [Phycisphaerales bacterium]|nr:PD40 domain-containing protein [Phycisphaerales bacterium]
MDLLAITRKTLWLWGLLGLGATASVRAEEVAYARHLALSPDGQTLAFAWAGDVWTVSAAGGQARRLTAHPAGDGHPVWSRDGRYLAFASDRHGSDNVFIMAADGTGVQRLTYSDRAEVPTDFTPDGAYVLFHARREGDVSRKPRIYRVPVAGGMVERVTDVLGGAGRVSPDGKALAFERGSAPDFTRRHYRGSANHDVWVHDFSAGSFRQVTNFDGADRKPIWSADGGGVYFLSDRDGPMNVWFQPLAGGGPEPVTRMTGEDVRDFTVAANGARLAFAHWSDVYVLDLQERSSRALRITAGDDDVQNDLDLRVLTGDASEAEVSPDGKEVALIVYGEVFVVSTEEGRSTRRVTDTVAREQHLTWSPDGKALFFVSDLHGQEDVYRATSAEQPAKPLSESLRFRVERVTSSTLPETLPQLSPDGKTLAFLRDRGDLILRDLKTGAERALLTGWAQPAFRWSPDSAWMAYELEDHEHNSDVWVVPVDGSQPAINITRHPDYDGGAQWSLDGKMLAFTSRRHGFDHDLYIVFLARVLDEKNPEELAAYFREQGEALKKRKPPASVVASGKIALVEPATTTRPQPAPAQKSPAAEEVTSVPDTQPEVVAATTQPDDPGLRAQVRGWIKDYLAEQEAARKPAAAATTQPAPPPDPYPYELETAYRRIRRVTTLPDDQSRFALAPDGQTLAFTSSHEGSAAVFTVGWNGENRRRILTGAAGGLHWSFDGKRLFYLRSGVANSCTATGTDPKTHRHRARLAVSRRAEAAQKFDDGARQIAQQFYHPTLKGLNWPAVTARYRELALRTRTLDEFNEVFNRMLGELSASHMGIFGPGSGGLERVGYLGVDIDTSYVGPGLKVARVLPNAPADRAASRLVPGDILTRIGGVAVGPQFALEQALLGTVGDDVIIEFLPSPTRGPEPEPPPTPAPSAPAPTDEPATLPQEPPIEPEPVPPPAPLDPDGRWDDSAWEDDPPVVVAPVAGAEPPLKDSAPTTTQSTDAPKLRELVLRPISFEAMANLRYDAWVRENERYVHEQSDGRVGYVHIRSMNAESFEEFERDLFAAASGRDGLIIDVRSNGGGWTADWVMQTLMVRRHAYTVPRGGVPGYPQDRLIFYAWTKPTTMMCNEESFSNAEIVSHAFKNLGRGPLVGNTTHGGVISTGSYRLIDNALVRMPRRGWFTLPDGVNMEDQGAVPDILKLVTPEDELRGRRPQLDAAVQATLEQIAGTP